MTFLCHSVRVIQQHKYVAQSVRLFGHYRVLRILRRSPWQGFVTDAHLVGANRLQNQIKSNQIESNRIIVVFVNNKQPTTPTTPTTTTPTTPTTTTTFPVGPGIDIWRSCMFLGCIIRFWARLLGGLGRFVPCSNDAHHCRLRHNGWEKCGRGLTSRPRETSDPGFLDSLLQVFGYPGGSGDLLIARELPLRYCSMRFGMRKPCWKMPQCGHVDSLLTPGGEGGLV